MPQTYLFLPLVRKFAWQHLGRSAFSQNAGTLNSLMGLSKNGTIPPSTSIPSPSYSHAGKPFCLLTIPVNAKLTVERIYIRTGSSAFDSVTFRLRETPSYPAWKKARFWTKLDDVNQMQIQPVTTALIPVSLPVFTCA